MQLKNQRREVAELLRNHKDASADIKVEGVIQGVLQLQAYEIIEVFLELVAMRSGLLANTKDIPTDMLDAVSSLVGSNKKIKWLI